MSSNIAVEYLLAHYTSTEGNWHFELDSHFNEFDRARAGLDDARARNARIRAHARTEGRQLFLIDDDLWEMRRIERPEIYCDAPDYSSNTRSPRGGYVVVRHGGNWDNTEAYRGCYLSLPKAEVRLVEMQRGYPEDNFSIYEIVSLNIPAEVPQTMFMLGQQEKLDGWYIGFGYGCYDTLAEARAAVVETRATDPEYSRWLIYEIRLVEIEHYNES